MHVTIPSKKWILPAVSACAGVLLVTSCVPGPEPNPTTTAGTVTADNTPTSTVTAGPDTESPGTTSADPARNTPSAGTRAVSPAPGQGVISSKVTLNWAVPPAGFRVEHDDASAGQPPQEPESGRLVEIGAAQHTAEVPPYDQISFRFQDSFPSYTLEYVPELFADPSGNPIPMPDVSQILKVTFHGTSSFFVGDDGSIHRTLKEAPAENVGYRALTRYSSAGDFEGVLIYGIGVGRPLRAAPPTKVRIYEVQRIEQGRRTCIVAIQLDATSWK